VTATGDAVVRFSHPTFDFGTELDPNPVPPWPLPAPFIDIEIVSMDLVSSDPFPKGLTPFDPCL